MNENFPADEFRSIPMVTFLSSGKWVATVEDAAAAISNAEVAMDLVVYAIANDLGGLPAIPEEMTLEAVINLGEAHWALKEMTKRGQYESTMDQELLEEMRRDARRNHSES